MKTKFTLALIALASVALLRADEPAKAAACCAAGSAETKPVAKDACCAAAETAAVPALALSKVSIYQLDAKWINDAGASVQLASLRGRPVVLAMFFASCEYACPIIVDDMKRLGAAVPADLLPQTQFVLVSFDTARDTPAALKAYRERMKLGDQWTLLHGDAENVQELAMLLGVKFKQDARGQFSHSNIITILNPAGEIAHQRAGLMGDVSEAAKAVALVATTK
jgi:protein SCO1/2